MQLAWVDVVLVDLGEWPASFGEDVQESLATVGVSFAARNTAWGIDTRWCGGDHLL